MSSISLRMIVLDLWRGVSMPTDKGGKPTLDELLQKTIDFLEKRDTPHLLIGGLAVGVVGEARVTQDVDLIVAVPLTELTDLARRAQAAGLAIIKASLEEAQVTGALRLTWKGLYVDIIFASTEFERSAFSRKRRVQLAGRTTYVPTPEDLILLKLVPGRPKDLFDIESILVRHWRRLDRKYLERWAQRLSDEAEDPRIWQTLQRLLKEADAVA